MDLNVFKQETTLITSNILSLFMKDLDLFMKDLDKKLF